MVATLLEFGTSGVVTLGSTPHLREGDAPKPARC
jgi:hypothetical protein